MKIVRIVERAVPISRYANPNLDAGDLDTSTVAIVTDVIRDGKPVIGYGFASIGRFSQGGLIRERFVPRLLAARAEDLLDESGSNFDPFRAWAVMMYGEKRGGHGERCVAVGTLDMAIWDVAAKIAGQPLYCFLAERVGREPQTSVAVYAAGGYMYPGNDLDLLRDGSHLAVDAMNRYSADAALAAAEALEPYGLCWFEDVCDPFDYETQARVVHSYGHPVAAGEALFSLMDAQHLLRYGGLRADKDVLVFDPTHCYGLPEYARILELFDDSGWSRKGFQPHGGHLFGLQVTAGLGLGGEESNPFNFQPFGGFTDDGHVSDGVYRLEDVPGIGFEARGALFSTFSSLLE